MSIIVKELSKIYGSGENRVTALDRASMEICDRDFISIVGPSGSGRARAALDQRSGPADFRYGAL